MGGYHAFQFSIAERLGRLKIWFSFFDSILQYQQDLLDEPRRNTREANIVASTSYLQYIDLEIFRSVGSVGAYPVYM